MSLDENKAGAAAVDPSDFNTVVDAVVVLQAGGGGGGSQTLAQVLVAGNDGGGSDMVGVWGLQAASLDPNPAGPSAQLAITTGGGPIETGGGHIDTSSDSPPGGSVTTGGGNIESGGGTLDSGGGDLDLGAGQVASHLVMATGKLITPVVAGIVLQSGSATFDATNAEQLPVIPTPQDIATALVNLGLVTQAS